MANYKLSIAAKEDLIRIHQYGVKKFGITQADKYFNQFFDFFDKLSNYPFSYEADDHIRKGYRRCPCGSDTIYFRLNNNVVEIMAIVGKQDLKSII